MFKTQNVVRTEESGRGSSSHLISFITSAKNTLGIDEKMDHVGE
jgi:hypothetical protein